MSAIELIRQERQRQIDVEGWSSEHDDSHGSDLLARAASCYREAVAADAPLPKDWPWEACWWKPKDPQRNLVKAEALYLAAAETAARANTPNQALIFVSSANDCAETLDRECNERTD